MLRLMVFYLLAGEMLPAQAPQPTTGKLDLAVTTSRDRKPIAGATVTWVDADRRSHVNLTGEDGHLRLSGLPPGIYTVREIQAAGYSNSPSNPLDPFYIGPGDTGVLHAAMVPNGSIVGSVLDEDGRAISGAVVVVHRYPPPPPGLERLDRVGRAVTNDDGYYLISDRAPASSLRGSGGRWVVRAYLPAERAVELGKGFEPAYSKVFEVYPGWTENIDFQLQSSPTFHIRGRVSGNSEAEGTFVSIQACGNSAEDNFATRTAVTRDGSFDAAGLIPGTYCLTFEVAQGTRFRARSYAVAAIITDRDADQVELKAWQ